MRDNARLADGLILLATTPAHHERTADMASIDNDKSRIDRDVRRIALRMEVYAAYFRDRLDFPLEMVDESVDRLVDREIAEEKHRLLDCVHREMTEEIDRLVAREIAEKGGQIKDSWDIEDS